MERGFGATVEVTKKAYDWMEEARLKNKPAMKLVPSQDLLSELRVTAVREALKTSGRLVAFVSLHLTLCMYLYAHV